MLFRSMTVLFISGLTPRNFLSSRGFGFRSVRPPKPWRYEIFGAKIARMREKIALFPRNSPYHLILFKKFSDICIPKGFHKTPYCRNSSAVEHFTRNEGVPSSNLGFGSKQKADNHTIIGLFFYIPISEIPAKTDQKQVFSIILCYLL